MKKSLLLLLALLFVAPKASAEEKTPIVARKMVRADELPYGDVKKLAPAQVVLPGAKEGGTVPASWKHISWDTAGLPDSRCLDGRTASVETSYPDVRTSKIVTIDGKDFLDVANISLEEDKVKVKDATRTPVMKIIDATANVAIWAYRRRGDRGPEVVFVAAVDHGVFDRAVGYGCALREHAASLPTNTLSFASSATTASEVAQRIWNLGEEGKRQTGKRPTWTGENYRVEASTSKSATDPAPMVAIYVRR